MLAVILWIPFVVLMACVVGALLLVRLILHLNAKRLVLCERIRVLEGDLKHLRENPLEDFCRVSIKFRRGNVTDYRDEVTNKARAERFVRDVLAALDGSAEDDRGLWSFFPHHFCDIKLSEVEVVQVSTTASERNWREEGIISFVRHDTRWCRWSVFMQKLLADLSLDGKNPMSPDAFRVLIGDVKLTNVRVCDWLSNSDFHAGDYRDWFVNIRKCLDAMKTHWLNDPSGVRAHFIRGMFPRNQWSVLDLLRTEEGTKQVMDGILAQSDLPKEEPETKSATEELAAGC